MNHVKELVNTLLPPSPSLRQTAWQNFISAQGIFLWCSECEVRNARMQICSVPSQSWRWLLKADRARGVDGAEWDCVSGRRNMPDQPWRWGVAYSGSTWAAVRVWWIRMIITLFCTWLSQEGEGRWSVEQISSVLLVTVWRKYRPIFWTCGEHSRASSEQ